MAIGKIRAIDTHYNGYKFRSRLEARWAVFFDALGIKYEYEREGYDLGESGWYLPDFSLYNSFVEIKPDMPDTHERLRASRLATCTGTKVVIFYGTPCVNFGLGYAPEYVSNEYPSVPSHLVFYGYREHLSVEWVRNDFSLFPDRTLELMREHKPYTILPCSGELLVSAANIARAARFEHGESPKRDVDNLKRLVEVPI